MGRREHGGRASKAAVRGDRAHQEQFRWRFAGYPKDELEQKLRGMPGGSFLEMRCIVDGVRVIAMAAKYNSK